jgi:hypothetical protein
MELTTTEVRFYLFVLIVMVLVIFLVNRRIRKKKRNEDNDSKRKQIYKGKRTKKIFFKKSLCTKKDKSSSNEDEFIDNDIERVIFMAVEDSNEEGTEEEYKEAEVDYIEELSSAIEVIKREKKKNMSLQA